MLARNGRTLASPASGKRRDFADAVLADEPTAHLDYIQVDGVLRLLRDLAAPGRVVIVATHDERQLPLADHVLELTPPA